MHNRCNDGHDSDFTHIPFLGKLTPLRRAEPPGVHGGSDESLRRAGNLQGEMCLGVILYQIETLAIEG